ncbi:MAG: hypothetical protein KDN05_17465 [Verrucomicrobiae bacterium]|nr:hypothetical protein [Verrucomicrobiae bacterium]
MKSDPVPEHDSNGLEMPSVEVVFVDDKDTESLDLGKVVDDTIQLLRQGRQAVKKGSKDLLFGSLRLCWLNHKHSAQGARNDLVPDGMKSGFLRVLDELALPSTTAYRWMSWARGFLVAIGVSDSKLPIPGTEEWTRMERYVGGKVEVLNLLGLPIRVTALPQDEEIITRIRVAAEASDAVAVQVLEELEQGVIDLHEATLRYCRAAKPVPGTRPLPAMLKLDPKTLQPEGRMIKALNTIEEAFLGWEGFPIEVRLQARQRLREVLAKMPAECNFHKF